jgi:FkbM family methyltransferase
MSLGLLGRLLPSGLAVPVVAGPLRGRRWILGAAAGVGGGASVLVNRAERDQLSRAAALVRPEDICFDVGANVGLYTLLLAPRCRRVVAFEPVPRNLRYLHRHVELNRLENVTIAPLAVTDREGLASFAPGDNCAVGHVDESGTQPVATVSIDGFVAQYGLAPSFIKMDVEGAEVLVLRGAERTLTAHRPAIVYSIHGEEQRESCREILRSHGYAVEPIDPAHAEWVAVPPAASASRAP